MSIDFSSYFWYFSAQSPRVFMIEVVKLTKRFGDLTAVNKLSFKLETGQTMALVGTSGCGKTTTLKMINHLIEPTEGKVFVNGENMLQQPPEQMRRKMGYVIQDIGLFPHYTIEENIAVVPKLLKWDKERTHKRVQSLMERLKLPVDSMAKKYPHQLSGGQQQRVGLARALAGDQPIILMDEPFGALDPITRLSIRDDFRELEELTSKTIILVTHDIQEAFEMSDIICVLDQGKIQQKGTPKELLFEPANDFVKRFLEDKLLELELHSVSMRDVFDELPAEEPRTDKATISVNPDETIMQVMEKVTKKSFEKHIAEVEIDGEKKLFDLDALVRTFHQKIKP